jgi:hypothetical protein
VVRLVFAMMCCTVLLGLVRFALLWFGLARLGKVRLCYVRLSFGMSGLAIIVTRFGFVRLG